MWAVVDWARRLLSMGSSDAQLMTVVAPVASSARPRNQCSASFCSFMS